MPVMSEIQNSPAATDPVCGMSVDPDTSPHRCDWDGARYYFCCEGCLKKFQADPQAYLDKAANDREQTPAPAGTQYTCPMHPEIVQDGPGDCPDCGMALEPMTVPGPSTRTQYTCPMHPEIVRDEPGDCPICGMALEPMTVTVKEEENPELTDMTRRFWVSAALSAPLLVLAMGGHIPDVDFMALIGHRAMGWVQFALATPVVLWGGWPFLVRGWKSVATWRLNMFTLIAIGVGVAYLYSLAAVLIPFAFPPAFRSAAGTVDVYFEAAAVITALVLLGQVLELRARSRTLFT